jgi:O-antigen/teichoic acid export membrane protein/thymidylate kinase
MATKPDMGYPDIPPAVISRADATEQCLDSQDFSRTLFRLLEEVGITYCLLTEFPADSENTANSLEMAIGPTEFARMPLLLQRIKAAGYLPLQTRLLAANDRRYDFARSHNAVLRLFSLTILAPYPEGQLITLDGEIISRRQKRGNCWVAAEADEFCHLLSKIGLHRKITVAEAARLQRLTNILGASKAELIVTHLFGDKLRQEVLAACTSGQWAETVTQLRGHINRAGRRSAFSAWLVYLLLQVRCSMQRWLNPSGIYVVILGPDGAGKSTLVNKILELMGPLFKSHRILQWRPQIIKPRARYSPYFNPPHAKPPHGTVESILRIFMVLFDYWVGYPILIRPLLARGYLLIYDRDFHDLLVDRLRYRYGGPDWLPDLAAKFIPQPETLYITLDADTDVILSRKQEVAPEEIKRQRVAYAKLAAQLPNSTLIHTDISLETSISGVTGAILTFLSGRFDRLQQELWPPPPAPTSQNEPASFSAANSNGNSHAAMRSVNGFSANWKSWLLKASMAIADQGLISGSNFVLSILLARYLSATQYGSYAIAYSAFILFSLVHQALVLEPMSVLGPSMYQVSLKHYLGLLTWIQLGFSAVVVVCLASAGIAGAAFEQTNHLTTAFIGMGIASPFVLLFWFARRAYYMHLMSGRAVVGAVAYSAFLALGIWSLYYTRTLSPFSAFLVMGGSALLTSVLLLIRLRSIKESAENVGRLTLRQAGWQHWQYGRWALVGMIFFWVPWNIFYSVVTRFSGLERTASLTALLNLALPMTATYGAFSLLFLPYTARVGAEGGWKAARVQAWRLAGLFVLGSGAYWLMVCVFRIQILQFLYKGHYAEILPLVPVVAVASVLSGAAMGPTIAIKAMRSPAAVSGVYFMSSAVAVGVGIPACIAWGYRGAIISILLSSLAACVSGFLKCSYPDRIRLPNFRSAVRKTPTNFSPATEGGVQQELP